jgi:hypothetical protein
MTTAEINETAPQDAGDETAVWQPDQAQTDQAEATVEPVPTVPAEHTVAAATSHPRRAGRVSSVMVLLAVSALVAVGGVGFAAGRATATGQTGTSQTSLAGANGAGAAQNGLPAGGPNASGVPGFDRGIPSANIAGTVTAVTSTTITIKLANGQSVTFSTASTTTYHSRATAASSDVTTGSTVVVQVSGGLDAAAAGGTGTATDVTITGK